MALPTTDDTTVAATDTPTGPLTKLETAKPAFSVMGSKVGPLTADSSSEIKSKLLEMIAAREAEKKGFGAMAEDLTPFAGPSSQWAANRQAVNETKKNRENDIVSMRMGIANMESEQQRIAQARQDQAQRQALMMNALGVEQPAAQGATPVAQGAEHPALAAVPPALTETNANPLVSGLKNSLTREQKMGIIGQFNVNESKGWDAFMAAVKPTDLQRELGSLGLPESAVRDLTIAAKAGDAFKTVKVPDPVTGYSREVSLMDLIHEKTARPVAGGAPAAQPQATPAAQPQATPAAQPQAAPQSVTGINVQHVAPFGTPEWQAENAEAYKANLATQQASIQEREKADNTQLAALKTSVDKAPVMMPAVQKAIEGVDAHAPIFGKLFKPTLVSTALNALNQGVQVGAGNFGTVSVSLPFMNEAALQNDPYVKKHPEALEAWQDVKSVMSKVLGDYTAMTNKGEGSISNQERTMYAEAVGSPEKLTAKSLQQRLVAVQQGYKHSQEVADAWNNAQRAGVRSFSEFKMSPEYDRLTSKQYYETSKALGVKNPPPWKPEKERDVTTRPTQSSASVIPTSSDLTRRLEEMKRKKAGQQ